ncbi:hypothetical protein ACXYMT_00585 [Salinimicrobium sp. CAU 1759]
MHNNIFRLGLVLALFLTVSCSKDSNEISASEFTTEVLPEEQVNRIEVVDDQQVLLYTNEKIPYLVKLEKRGMAESFVDRIRFENENASVQYTYQKRDFSWFLTFYQLLPILFVTLILLQIILLWFSLKKITKGRYEPLEKLVHLVIVLFAPIIGPLVFLTSRRPS